MFWYYAGRALRLLFGLALLSLLFLSKGPFRFAGLIGIFPLLSGVIDRCPINGLAGLLPGRRKGRE